MSVRATPCNRVAVALIFLLIYPAAAAPATAPPTAPATQPSLPSAADVGKLSDATLYDLYQLVFPEANVDTGMRSGGDLQADLKDAIHRQIESRSKLLLQARLGEKAPADVERL